MALAVVLKEWKASTEEGSSNFSWTSKVPRSAGMESKPQAETIKHRLLLASSWKRSSDLSMNSVERT